MRIFTDIIFQKSAETSFLRGVLQALFCLVLIKGRKSDFEQAGFPIHPALQRGVKRTVIRKPFQRFFTATPSQPKAVETARFPRPGRTPH